jgi:uncharacterized membrane-anchored protein
MQLFPALDYFLAAAGFAMLLSIPFVLRNWKELEEKGFEVKRFLIVTFVGAVWILLLVFVLS